MKIFLLGLIFCILAAFGIVAYGLNANIDFLSSENFKINGISLKYPVINYNGNVYVPIRFVSENMATQINYNDNTKTISIEQSSVKFDERISAPVPYVAYERYHNGTLWMQEIPLLQGTSCWKGCIEVPGSHSEIIKQFDYPPVSMEPESQIKIVYPRAVEPKNLIAYIEKISEDVNEENEENKDNEINIVNDRLQLPIESGIYHIVINSGWDDGHTTYMFMVEIK
ncbi:stalk domain-containing protein [Paenibacillus eucommiae]|uniref:Copper amine oxidase-like N-terminal domain-containing protein n=1 Tax=Paenibacillus eucommiae TaxID=1355755 RepID=A0ABS4IS28_9BACL|nr:stalk domain-containing protein [Paenibacillus eucommiae]MBP1989821.1 hypothetical protein [Paenibacillus eucommiae]